MIKKDEVRNATRRPGYSSAHNERRAKSLEAKVRDVINFMLIFAARPGEVYTLNLTPEEMNECALKKKGDFRQYEMMDVKGIQEQIVFMAIFRYRHDGCSIIEVNFVKVKFECPYSRSNVKFPDQYLPQVFSGLEFSFEFAE
ncbi:hypothetical protein CHS0354_032701 [Potamilus streckersoni]|uniref:Uncharacterized protein n=1 Tax=Potamilus streckersoni TaxID=2493646 RepID=A0AAE0VGS6_9BIVA|nr:hypothetical protein CHS0354_032701 [Potamilus streckersoni]